MQVCYVDLGRPANPSIREELNLEFLDRSDKEAA